MTTRSGSSSSPHQIWRPAHQAVEEDAEEKEKDRKFNDAMKSKSGSQRYKPWSGPSDRREKASKSTGESEGASSTSTRRGADNAPEAPRGPQQVPPSSTKASSAGTNSDAQLPASERTYSHTRDSQSTKRSTTVSFDNRPSNSPMSTSSVPPGRRPGPQLPQERTPQRPLSNDKTTRSQKATVESDVDEDATDSEVEKGSNRPPASMAHTPVSSKAVVDDTSSSEQIKEQTMPSERHPRPYSQSVNERIALRPTTPTSDGTRSTRQDMESNDRKRTQEVQEQRKRLQEDDLRQKREAEERQKQEAGEQRERKRVKEEEERQRAEAHARGVQEQREREKQRQEMEARDREREKQLQEAEQRKRLQEMQEAEQRERLRKKQEDEQRETLRQRREDESRDRERMEKEQEFARREKEAKSRYQERKRAEDEEKERERRRRATGGSSSGTSYASGGTSAFPGSPPPFGSFGSGFPASSANFSSAGTASTQNVAPAWEKYDRAWTALETALKEKAAQAPLRWRDIPWPMVAQPFNSEDLVKNAIANFFLSPTHSQSKSPKERLREALLRWHPDRFESRWLPKCVEKDREEIKTGVGFVIRCLNELMSVDGAFGSPP